MTEPAMIALVQTMLKFIPGLLCPFGLKCKRHYESTKPRSKILATRETDQELSGNDSTLSYSAHL
jgi:hypothetical protein